MNHTEELTRYTANFIDELVCSGLSHAVISPGSRSTPLAVLFAEHDNIHDWVLVDERSAAYFALGIAKETKRPVALVCTSGTAAANYFPAIVEAYYARVPLLILTADRPHELRGIGASQTINQLAMYGDFVKEFWEMAPPDATAEMLQYVRNRAGRAMQVAIQGNPGPVHVNFPFQEPLMPDIHLQNLWGQENNLSYNPSYVGKKRLAKSQLERIVQTFSTHQKGLFVCGPQVDEQLAQALVSLSETLQVPILADPLSQIRAGKHAKSTIISTYDTIFKTKEMRANLKPDYIVRFGAMPISKNYLFFIREHADIPQFVVENSEGMREPTNHNSEYIFAHSTEFCNDLLPFFEQRMARSDWLQIWQKKEAIAVEHLMQASDTKITEGIAVRDLLTKLPDHSRLFVANSMPVRDVDTFFVPTDKHIIIHANRGVSGIDGTVSSALGVAAASGQQVFLIIGDLSFYHDLNSLLVAKRYGLQLTVLLINNDGGGIFSFLPQAKEEKHFEHLFGTPLAIDFRKAVDLYDGHYELVSEVSAYEQVLQQSFNKEGLTVVEVQTDRTENVAWHRKLWGEISDRLQKND